MRNILEYPITQEEKDRFIIDVLTRGGIGDPTPLILAEILADFAEEHRGIQDLHTASKDYINQYRFTTAYEQAKKGWE